MAGADTHRGEIRVIEGWMSSATAPDAYAILGVAWDADDEVIAAAYRALARRFHPDVAGDLATRRMMEINAAFEAIRTAERRADYFDALPEDGVSPMARGAAAQAAARARARAATATGSPPPGTPSTTSGAATPAADDARDPLRWRPPNDGTGGAGPPPGRPSGSVLGFGRHIGWSLGEIARVDPGYLSWLLDKREGRPYAAEIEALLERVGYRPAPVTPGDPGPGRGVFRR